MTNLNSLTKNIVILGASGWIGKNFVCSLNQLKNVNLYLYSFKEPKTIKLKKDLTYKTQPIQNINEFKIAKDIDANYYKDYIEAKKAGVNFLAYRCYLSSKEIKIEKKIKILNE